MSDTTLKIVNCYYNYEGICVWARDEKEPGKPVLCMPEGCKSFEERVTKFVQKVESDK